MKRFSHIPTNLACILGGVFVACSGDHALTDPDVSELAAIGFGCNIAEPGQQTTRAVGLETIHPSFHVWSCKELTDGTMQPVIEGYEVDHHAGSAGTTETNTAGWEYVGLGTNQVIKYWDFSATSYRFWGYAGDGATTSADGTVITIPGLGLTTSEPSAALFSSLKVVESAAFGQTVQLEFLRPYVKLRVGFYTSEPLSVGDDISITDVIFAPTSGTILKQGDMVISYPLSGPMTWSINAGTQTQGDLPFEGVTLTSTQGVSSDKAVIARPNVEAEFYYLLPVSSGNPSFQLSATINEEPKAAIVPANFMQWKPNFLYTYLFKITEAGKKIEFFDVRIDPWKHGGSQDEKWTNW